MKTLKKVIIKEIKALIKNSPNFKIEKLKNGFLYFRNERKPKNNSF